MIEHVIEVSNFDIVDQLAVMSWVDLLKFRKHQIIKIDFSVYMN